MMNRLVKLYISEHKELLMAVFVSGIGISGLLAFLERDPDYFYLGMLYLFVFLVGVGFHFYKNIPLYKSLLGEVKREEDIFLEGHSLLAGIGRDRMRQIRHVYEKRLEQLEQENQNYKLVMNKWVHQMKTPLSVLHMMAQEHTEVPSESIAEETDRMEYLLNQVLQLVRMENLKNDFIVKRCSLSDIVKEAVNEQKSYFIRNEVFPKMEIDASMFVYTDPKWCAFVLQQILSNAVKYSEPGQRVIIRGVRTKGSVDLSIQDFGIGILPEDAARIYEFCYTGNNGRKKQKESSGLGLYLVKHILEYLGHTIVMSSVPGEGTTFTVSFNTDR